MDKGQILADYRLAKNHRRRINILADLNACDPLTIIDILKEGGYDGVFNSNGVDISVKRKEIEKRYASGENIVTLAMAYHISKKQIRALLKVDETEEKAVTERKDQAATSVDEKEKASLRVQLEEYKTANEELMKRVKELESHIVEMKRTGKTDSDLFDKYQQLCIQNNKLSTTVDVLLDKISMLKAVGCHG